LKSSRAHLRAPQRPSEARLAYRDRASERL